MTRSCRVAKLIPKDAAGRGSLIRQVKSRGGEGIDAPTLMEPLLRGRNKEMKEENGDGGKARGGGRTRGHLWDGPATKKARRQQPTAPKRIWLLRRLLFASATYFLSRSPKPLPPSIGQSTTPAKPQRCGCARPGYTLLVQLLASSWSFFGGYWGLEDWSSAGETNAHPNSDCLAFSLLFCCMTVLPPTVPLMHVSGSHQGHEDKNRGQIASNEWEGNPNGNETTITMDTRLTRFLAWSPRLNSA